MTDRCLADWCLSLWGRASPRRMPALGGSNTAEWQGSNGTRCTSRPGRSKVGRRSDEQTDAEQGGQAAAPGEAAEHLHRVVRQDEGRRWRLLVRGRYALHIPGHGMRCSAITKTPCTPVYWRRDIGKLRSAGCPCGNHSIQCVKERNARRAAVLGRSPVTMARGLELVLQQRIRPHALWRIRHLL